MKDYKRKDHVFENDTLGSHICEDSSFTFTNGSRPESLPSEEPHYTTMVRQHAPWLSAFFLVIIILGCACCELFIPKDPACIDLANCNVPPNREFWFGTDTMGRDLFSVIWYGGRLSLFIGFAATAISTGTAILYGTACGLAPAWLDALLMRLSELLLSVPNLLFIIFLQAICGDANAITLAAVIGMTGWFSMAKVIRTEVRQIRSSGYVTAAKCMGGSFFHILVRHLLPNFLSSIMFMIVMNIRSAIAAEATLSFMGLGLPPEIISWGSMLSLSQRALTNGSWWMIVIPGLFLVATLVCVTDIGNYLQKRLNHGQRNL